MSIIKSAFWLSVVALTIASLVPVALLPEQSANIWDKGQHVAGFAWLGVLGLLAYPQRPLRTGVLLLAFGGAIEMAQAATGWRFGEWLDLLADGVGILVGAVMWWLARRSPRATA